MGKGYGWKAALNLANQGESTDENGDVRSALLNSDSLALFGSGMSIRSLTIEQSLTTVQVFDC